MRIIGPARSISGDARKPTRLMSVSRSNVRPQTPGVPIETCHSRAARPEYPSCSESVPVSELPPFVLAAGPPPEEINSIE
jgi:hypothetical protein